MISFLSNHFRLLRSFIQIYRITLIILLLGSVGIITVAMLMIQLALVQVKFIIFWHIVPKSSFFLDVYFIKRFSLSKSNSQNDSMMLWETIFCGFWALSLLFVACELGQRYSNGFNEIGKAFAEVNWYLLPIEIQRMLPTIMIYLQEPNDFRIFGNISTSRKQFQKVSR